MFYSAQDLLAPLRRYWGYSAFRPLQERIVRSLLGGHDTCVVMPTGGGKSLCYQLPALMSERTAIVISPLIALMQDQVTQLAQMGISAGVLNSSLSHEEQTRITREARQGAYRLLYLSPERLQRADTIEWLKQVPISFFAIDEAHCISEWGHEFRPEYRQLSKLRLSFPNLPIAAFTASATRQVRHDILTQLALRDPDKYIASFHRPNLRYLIRQCHSDEHFPFFLRALENYVEGNVIVYSPTIAKVEETVDFLGDHGIPAVAYHAKMPPEERRRNQERWMSDEVRVLVGTIAFGLGINKANVRAVIHLALPKSIEQFYQEAGRGGRDGKPADCLLLWRKQDAALLAYFANQIQDTTERERAWQRYHKIRDFAESRNCRHLQICSHFGGTPKWTSCNACDICGNTPEWLGVAEHQSTEGRGAPKHRPDSPVRADDVASQANPELREYLREWRRLTAKELGVPAFVVLHDTTLEEICRIMPSSIAQLRTVSGIGERKAETFGQRLLTALRRFQEGDRASALPQKRTAPSIETLSLITQGKTLQEIARIRGRQLGTVISAVVTLVENGEVDFSADWIDRNKQAVIEAACRRAGIDKIDRLKPLKDSLPPEITYDEIRLVLAQLRREENQHPKASA